MNQSFMNNKLSDRGSKHQKAFDHLFDAYGFSTCEVIENLLSTIMEHKNEIRMRYSAY